MNCTMPGITVIHYLMDFAQTHVHWFSDANQPSHLLSLHTPLDFKLFKESALHIRWPKYLRFSFCINPSKEYSGLIFFRIDWFDLCYPMDSQESSPALQLESIHSSAFSLLYVPKVSSIHDYWKKKKHSLTIETFISMLMTSLPPSSRGFLRPLYYLWLWVQT